MSSRPSRTLCLGEALVDLICERPVRSVGEADAFAPHQGGAVANVAAVAAHEGASVALAGGAGEDPWGVWLQDRLARIGVDLSLFELVPGARTPIALVTVDAHGEAHYQIYGEGIATVVHALGERVEHAVEQSAALFISSNTLVGDGERKVTMRARQLALEHGRHLIFDPNLRLHRWSSPADAAATANACVPGALLIRANEPEAALMTGEQDVERAAHALLDAGASMVVLTRGERGAILRGAAHGDAAGVTVRAVSTVGAGDVLMGVLLAALAESGFEPAAVAEALPAGVAAAGSACQRWGALD